MAAELTHYTDLGVDEAASAEEIEDAYQRLVANFHPDLNEADRDWLRHLDKAYAVLSDPERRREYDQHLAARRGQYSTDWTKPTGDPPPRAPGSQTPPVASPGQSHRSPSGAPVLTINRPARTPTEVLFAIGVGLFALFVWNFVMAGVVWVFGVEIGGITESSPTEAYIVLTLDVIPALGLLAFWLMDKDQF